MMIERPGIYRGVASADYHSDLCPEPALSQSIAKLMLERSPWHAWTAHPRLNPRYEPDDDTKFDLGNVVHSLILGRGKDFEVLPYDDWRSKAAKEAREELRLIGKVAVLQHQFDRASDMLAAVWQQLSSHEDRDAFKHGDAEVMIAWQEDGIWLRSLVDYLHEDLCTVDDYKSTDMSVAPHVLGYRAEAAGWHIQAAFIERGLDVLNPENKGRRRFRFIAQETAEPHALSVMHMDEHWMTMGRKAVDAAIRIWKLCMKTNAWPGYTPHSVVPQFPGYKEAQWLDREVSGEFDPKLIMAG